MSVTICNFYSCSCNPNEFSITWSAPKVVHLIKRNKNNVVHLFHINIRILPSQISVIALNVKFLEHLHFIFRCRKIIEYIFFHMLNISKI